MAVDIDGEKRECFRSRPRWRWWKETIYNGDSQCIPLWFRSGSDLIIEDLYHEFLLLVFVSISQIWNILNIIFIVLFALDFLFYVGSSVVCCFLESHWWSWRNNGSISSKVVFVMERGDDERKRVAGSQERLVVMSLSSTSNRHQKGWLKMEREKKKGKDCLSC